MAKDLSYKRVTTTTLIVKGDYSDESTSVILTETGEIKTLAELFKSFDGELIECTIKIKTSEDLDIDE